MKRKGCFGWLVGIALVILLVAGGLFGYAYFKVKGTADSIHEPIAGREKSDLRDKAVDIENKDSISVALFGVDANATRLSEGDHGRTDTIILLSINPNNKKTVMVSIPRDTYSEMVGHGTNEKIAHAYAYGGAEMAVKSVEKLMNVPIDYYAAINMDGMQELIDTVGGVDVTSNATFSAQGESFVKGQQVHLDGEKALIFIRSRKEDGAGNDFGRQERQQIVIQGLAHKLLSAESITKVDGILQAVQKNIVTDMSFSDLTSLQSGYSKTLNNVEKYQLEGTGQTMDDGLWYFMADDAKKNEISTIYKENLK
ncbi:LytR family transcriptional regulator [Macrococcus hajekii]|uniref:LytR family transcriptional regulator n=1 Tax=Macrococcus hajekii TaxID=198482 RepID=A0A4R6BHT3_9STAP|nr:LCP family protein [Macrococcus hajekii]TDM01147.1 LytR family transcriptional regulator [Macrococcus hajekii]GGB12093.1 LytR family transcriptional regulator [Macrococcus hajekii]